MPKKSQKFLIVRHAESTANVKGLLAGRIDPTRLTAKGRRAAQELQHTIEAFEADGIYVSPMLRCRETIEFAGVSNFGIDERLIEMDYGRWNGEPLRSLSKRREWKSIQKDPENFAFPRGESFLDAWNRISDFLIEIESGPLKNILVVTHGDISRMLITQLLDKELNSFQRILIEPASHSLLIKGERGEATIGYMNRVNAQTPQSRPSQKQLSYQLGGE